MEKKTLTRPDGLELYYYIWQPAEPRALVLLIHGMTEHPLRYDAFATTLSEAGFAVYAPAHRGHGETGRAVNLMGYFAEGNGWQVVLDDLDALRHRMEADHPGLPVLLFGHSMGSFLSRCYIQTKGGGLAGVVLSGTAGPATGLHRLLSLLARSACAIKGTNYVSPMLNKLTSSQQMKGIKNPRTGFDWLTRVEAEVDKYIADPDCGFPCTNGFFRDLTHGWLQFSSREANQGVPKNLPILLVSGEADPVGDHGRGVRKTEALYRELGIRNLRCVLIPGARHELLNETPEVRKEVTELCLHWLQEQAGIAPPAAQ